MSVKALARLCRVLLTVVIAVLVFFIYRQAGGITAFAVLMLYVGLEGLSFKVEKLESNEKERGAER